jgi:hypothetical protein
MESQALAVYCTCPDQVVAERIAEAVVSERLAACVNLVPGRDLYLSLAGPNAARCRTAANHQDPPHGLSATGSSHPRTASVSGAGNHCSADSGRIGGLSGLDRRQYGKCRNEVIPQVWLAGYCWRWRRERRRAGCSTGSAIPESSTFSTPIRRFKLIVNVLDPLTLEARWTIAPGYYLYRDKFQLSVLDAPGVSITSLDSIPARRTEG